MPIVKNFLFTLLLSLSAIAGCSENTPHAEDKEETYPAVNMRRVLFEPEVYKGQVIVSRAWMCRENLYSSAYDGGVFLRLDIPDKLKERVARIGQYGGEPASVWIWYSLYEDVEERNDPLLSVALGVLLRIEPRGW